MHQGRWLQRMARIFSRHVDPCQLTEFFVDERSQLIQGIVIPLTPSLEQPRELSVARTHACLRDCIDFPESSEFVSTLTQVWRAVTFSYPKNTEGPERFESVLPLVQVRGCEKSTPTTKGGRNDENS